MVFLILIILISLIVILSGGRISNLKYCNFKLPILVFLALVLKIISISIYSPVVYLPVMRISSMVLVIIFIFINFHLKGMLLIGLGLISNALVIFLNGGNMPANAKYVYLFASGKELEILRSGQAVGSFILTSSQTKLSFLGDVFLMPRWIPLSKLYSIGDILITIGAIIFLTYYLKKQNNVKSKYMNFSYRKIFYKY